MTIRHMRTGCWVPNATNTPTGWVTLVFPQQWLHECALVLRYTYIACLVVLVKRSGREIRLLYITFCLLDV
jgi:hypothetical protein